MSTPSLARPAAATHTGEGVLGKPLYWMWVLVEEGIRAAFWFNPAMWWVISRVQSSREEVVDELTIQLTNNRQTYLEALLAFADEPTLFPATPFARRRVPPLRHQTGERRAVVEDDREPVWVAKLVDDRGTRQPASK